MLDKYRFNRLFHIVIDSISLYSNRINLGNQAITKVYNKGEENEYTLYSFMYQKQNQFVIIGLFLQLLNLLKREIYTDKSGNTYRKFDKQDYKLKDAYRLLNKSKKKFPKLPIIIGGDALYLGRPFLKLCDKHKFQQIIRYKETDAPTIKRKFDEIKVISGNYEYQNEIIFGNLKDNDFYTLNVISYSEESIS